MALEAPMEAWFSSLWSGRTERLDPAGDATGSDADRTQESIHAGGGEAPRTFDIEALERRGEYALDIAFYGSGAGFSDPAIPAQP
jgi:hypothetical protein